MLPPKPAVLLSVPLSVALGPADLRLLGLLRLAVSQHLVLRSPDLPPTMSFLTISGRLALLPQEPLYAVTTGHSAISGYRPPFDGSPRPTPRATPIVAIHTLGLPVFMNLLSALSRSATALTLATGFAMLNPAFAAVEFGQPSVQSYQGQRLKIALPYSRSQGERVSLSRFSVDSVTLADGRVLDGKKFTLMAPLNRNIVVLQSPDNVYGPSVKLAMKVSNQEAGAANFDLALPAFRAATSEASSLAPKNALKSGKRRPVKKSIHRSRVKAKPSIAAPSAAAPVVAPKAAPVPAPSATK